MNLNPFKKIMDSVLVFGLFLFIAFYIGKGVIKAAEYDSIAMTTNIGDALVINVDTTDISISELVPEVADTDETTTLTIASNDPEGFSVTALLKDLDGNANAELCVNNGSGACSGTILDVFDTDEGTHSYFKIQIDTANSTADSITGYSGQETATVMTTSATEVIEADGQTEIDVSDTVVVDYQIFADTTVPEWTYQGDIVFTITGKP